MKIFHYIVATGLGVGFFPFAPGTAGSIFSLLLIYVFTPVSPYIMLLLILLSFFVGVYSSTRVEKERGHDPSIVVIDEILGMGIGLLFLPRNLLLFIIAFILFRIFDIFKPPPINASQKFRAGWGIMMDDVVAGLYTLIIMQLLRLPLGI
ncbi:MAG: phosphatidylglycerophosphatase A [bacterium]|nr:MAG: phosphatidylglycerophosphatase A [bacterium]